MYYFEDSGGVLPVHEVGVTTTGLIPGSGKMDLHWTAEIGNGSSEFGTANFGDGVENFASDRNRKDVNFAIYSKPEWLPGVQIGGSYLRGDLIPLDLLPKVNQEISSAYIVYNSSRWESLNEIALMQHQITDGGRSFTSPMGYTQLAYRMGRYRPYFRFQEVNIPNNDPVTGFKGRYEGPSVGARMDFFEYAARNCNITGSICAMPRRKMALRPKWPSLSSKFLCEHILVGISVRLVSSLLRAF